MLRRCVALAVMAAPVLACGDSAVEPRPADTVRVSVLDAPDSLQVERSDTLRAVVVGPADDTTAALPVSWTSSNPRVITVDSAGRVRAVGTGTAYIRAEIEQRADSVAVRGFINGMSAPASLIHITSGFNQDCALDVDGNAYCRGQNNRGQYGNGTISAGGPTRKPAAEGYQFRLLTSGQSSVCGMTTDGTALCWGHNSTGELGLETRTPTQSPTPVVPNGPAYLTIETGDHAGTCAIATDSLLLCWGHNDLGQLGRHPWLGADSVIAPTRDSLRATEVSLGMFSGCALDVQLHPWCWGGNLRAPPYTDSALPRRIDASREYHGLATGDWHACALDDLNGAWCWGDGSYGVLGDKSETGFAESPRRVQGGHQFVQLSASQGYTCGITIDNRLLCWGLTPLGRASRIPAEMFPGHSFAAVSAGLLRFCALSTSGVPYCFGAPR